MRKFHRMNCAPRGVVRDRRQQTGKALSPVRGGVDTVKKFVAMGLQCEHTHRELFNRVIVHLEGRVPAPENVQSWSKVSGKTYEVIATRARIMELLQEWDATVGVYKVEIATHRAHGPGYQQSRPYHRR